MKKVKVLSIFLFTLCLAIIFGGNIRAVNINYVSEGQPLVNVEYKDLKPLNQNHIITLEETNASDRFMFYSTSAGYPKKTINNNYPAGYNYYILPYGAATAGDGRDSYNVYFNGNEYFTVRYHNVATYKGRNVDCLVKISPRSAGADNYINDWITSYEGINFTNYGAIAFHDSFYQGFTYFNTGGITVSYNLVYEGTSTNIGITNNMYWSWGSVNKPEGIASCDTVNSYYLVNSSSYAHTAFTNFSSDIPSGISKAQEAYAKNYGAADGVYWGVGLDAQNCSDTWRVGDFDRTFVGFNVSSSTGIYTFKTLSHDFWFCPFFEPIGATAPDPTKSVRSGTSGLWLDSTEVFVGDTIQFACKQQVEDRNQGGTGYMKYTSFKLVDTLPSQVEYVSAKVVRVEDNVDVTRYGNLNINGNTVTFEFSSDFLANLMLYNGETYQLIITCVVDDDSVEGKSFTNSYHSIINNTDRESNKVIVTPYYKYVKFSLLKQDSETGATTQGDSKLNGAVYGIYEDSYCTKLRETITTDENGNASSSTFTVVNYKNGIYTYRESYYIKEITPSEGYLLDTTVYNASVSRNDYSIENQIKFITKSYTSREPVIKNDIEITKYLEETDSTDKQKLSGAIFRATLNSDPTQVWYSTITNDDGYCVIKDLPYGKYTVEEVTIPYVAYDGMFYVGDSITRTKTLQVYISKDKNSGTKYQYDLTDVAKKMQIIIYKEDNKTGIETQGDATLEGAEYTIYRDSECTDVLETIVVRKNDKNGTWIAESGWYLVGTYYVKETKAPEGYLIDENIYKISQDPKTQTTEKTTHTITSKEEVWKGSVKVIKFENILGTTEERPATGAILRLTLNSSVTEENPDGVYYDVTVDEKGYGEFVNELLIDYYPNTIPYGLYTITEIKESDLGFHTYFYIKPETIDLRNKNEQVEYRIFGEEPIQAYLKVQKVDKDTNSKVKVAGAKYKIWDVQNEKWVSQMVSPSGYFIEEFETNEDGYFITPEKLLSGDYVIYETQSPEGYYLNDEYRIPENSDDLGDATKSGVAVRIDSIAMGLINGDQLIYDPTAELVYEQQIKNDPLKVKLEINKTGEVLSEVIATSSKYGEKYTPKYTIQGLEGVTYDIYAAQDIKSPDRTQTYVVKGTKVDTITTNENGIAITKELYPGEYEIKETDTPMGYIADENIPNVVLTNTNTLKRVEIHNKELTNKRQKLELTFKKVFEDVNFANGENIEKKAIFGVYTNQDINNYKGNVLIPKDKLVDIIEVDENNPDVTSTIDLPEGRYYVKELETSFPYTIGSEIKYFELNYTDNNDEFVVKQGTEYVNNYESASITLVKLSTSTIDNLVLDGENVETNDLDKNVNELIDEFKGMTEDEIKEYLQKNDVKFVSGATYRVYTDKECLKPLYIKSGDKFVEADIVTDESGLIKLENIPVGKYYIKEVVAPKGYQLSEEVLEIELTSENKNTMVYKALIENSVVASIITKLDIFTGDVVPNCVFEIKDDEGRVLLHSITNEEGKAFIPLDLFENGKTYTYTEIEAPEMYELNTEPHEFVAKFDEETYEWLGENIKVENTRKKGKVITSYIDIDTGIEIADREYTGDYVGLDYDTFAKEIDGYELVVELIPANKDGQYTIEDIYVKYYYRKIDNAETGDINIYVLGIILVISTTAMMYTIKRNLIIKP